MEVLSSGQTTIQQSVSTKKTAAVKHDKHNQHTALYSAPDTHSYIQSTELKH